MPSIGMDELAGIRTFISVVETGSFSAAARRGNLSVSAVARSVKALEEQLETRLLNRNTRHQSLTEAGQAYFERVKLITSDLREAKQEVKSLHETVQGRLRLSLRTSAAVTLIGPALPVFLTQHPELTLDVSLTDGRLDLISTETDVAVWLGDLPDSELVARRLSPNRRLLCGSPGYLESRGVPVDPDDLKDHQCLTDTRFGHEWLFVKDQTQRRVKVSGSLQSDNGLLLVSAALAGLGLVVVQEWIVRRLLAEGKLVSVLADHTVNSSEREAALYVVYPGSRAVSRKVRVFVDFLVSLFRAEPSREGRVALPS